MAGFEKVMRFPGDYRMFGGIRMVATGLFLGIGLQPPASLSAPDPVALRQHLMSNAGQATRFAERMTTGERPFDAARAAAAMRIVNEVPGDFVKLFPTGGKSTGHAAQDEISRNMADFLSHAQKLKRLSARAMDASKEGEASFRRAFEALTRNCNACHQRYRRLAK